MRPIKSRKTGDKSVYLKFLNFPGGTRGKELACQCRRPKRLKFDCWVWKIPWRKPWQPLQYFCLENPKDKGAWCYRPWGHKESDTNEVT